MTGLVTFRFQSPFVLISLHSSFSRPFPLSSMLLPCFYPTNPCHLVITLRPVRVVCAIVVWGFVGLFYFGRLGFVVGFDFNSGGPAL